MLQGIQFQTKDTILQKMDTYISLRMTVQGCVGNKKL